MRLRRWLATAALLATASVGDRAFGQNRVVNGEFDADVTTGWSNVGAGKTWNAFDDSNDPTSGSLLIINYTAGTGQFVQQCFEIEGGRDYDVAYSHYSSGAATTGRADFQINWWLAANCTNNVGYEALNSSVAGAWTDVAERVTAPVAAVAASIQLESHKNTGDPGDLWAVYFDHVFVPEPGAAASSLSALAGIRLLCGVHARRGRAPRAH